MFLREMFEENKYKKTSDSIKKELLLMFKQKGIEIKEVNVDLSQDNLNLSVSLNDNGKRKRSV